MRIFISLFIITVIFSCNKEEQPLKLIKVTERSSSKISDLALVKVLEENNIKIDISYTLYEDSALSLLEKKEVDMVIVPNNAGSDDFQFKLLAPLLPRLLIIYTNKETGIKDLKELFENGKLYFEDRSNLDSLFFEKLYYNYGIDESKVEENSLDELDLTNESDALLVYIGLTHINNDLIKQLADDKWLLFSLDEVENYGYGSKVEGFTMMNNSVYSFLIPMYVYKRTPKKPILTVAMKDVLICREDLNKDVAYSIIKVLVENKMKLIKSNSVYNLLDFEFNDKVWAFPLHSGTRSYIEKDEPSMLMLWVRDLWPVISITVVFIGAFSSLRGFWRKKDKQNIESYYTSLNEIKQKTLLLDKTTDINSLLKELMTLKVKAIDTLANNKFDSSQSFNIFLALYTEVKNDLIDALKEKDKHS